MMKSRAAVAFAPGKPLDIVELEVAPPQKGEVLVRISHTGVCQGARLPSQRRFVARAKSEAEGIVLNKAEMEQLDRLCALGLDAVL